MEKRGCSESLQVVKKLKTTLALKSHNSKTCDEFEPSYNISFPSATEIALLEWKASFPSEKFQMKLPPIVFLHQLYTSDGVIGLINLDLNALQSSGKILIFNFCPEVAIIFTDDFQKCIQNYHNPEKKILHFVMKIMPEIPEVIEKSVLKKKHNLTDNDISALIRFGLLIIKDASKYKLSIPGGGSFMKSLYAGRKYLLTAIKKSKYKELLVTELECRSKAYEKAVKVGIKYQVADLVGSKLVERISTTSGPLLRYISQKKVGRSIVRPN